MIETLKKYWKAGLATLPVKNDKSPCNVSSWKGGIKEEAPYLSADGIGIICGEVSGGLECLDFDNHFGDAKQNLTNFINQIKPLYYEHAFPIQATQNGGFHLLYRCDFVEGNQKLAQRPRWFEKEHRYKPDAIVETRGEGGYFVASPTPKYQVVKNDIHKIPRITVKEREKIIFEARQLNRWYESKTVETEKEGRPGDLFNQDISSGDVAKQALRKAGWNEMSKGWTRPGKDDGVSATFGKVAENIFYVFSSNAYPFEPNKGYTPFQVVCLLDYNGDFNTFASELSAKYQTKKPEKKHYAEANKEPRDAGQLEELVRRAFIDISVPVIRPPVIMEVVNRDLYSQRLFTLGNFSVITGKSKSKKTFLSSALLASAIKNGNIQDKFISTLPEGKNTVILFDTEQSNYDAYLSAKRAVTLAGGGTHDNFLPFDLREFTAKERCEIIEYTLEKYKDNTSYIIIDGVADLANAINDELEASRVVGLLMRWTKIYQVHITTIIHQNKNDNFATGHLGSGVMKKSECVISVEKDPKVKNCSKISCDLIRGVQDFDDFTLEINHDGLPIFYYEERKVPKIDKMFQDEEVPF